MDFDTGSEYIEHEMLEEGVLEARDYQLELAAKALTAHSLVVLPTGTGKTPIAAMIMAERLSQFPDHRILMMAPTKPLVDQHVEFLREVLWISDDRIKSFNGDVRPDKREELWGEPDTTIVVSTPQCMKNDVTGNRVDLSDVCHLVVDECHRATGDYPYNYVADRYHATAEEPLVTGLSASPGSDREQILEVCRNLGIQNVVVKTEDDESLAKYTYDTEIKKHDVELPDETIAIRDLLQEAYKERLKDLKSMDIISSARKDFSMGKLQRARGDISKMISNDESDGYKAASIHAQAVKIAQGIEAIESQTVEAMISHFERIQNKADSSSGSKADSRVISDAKVQEALRRARNHDATNPKLVDMLVYIHETVEADGQAIVFTESRDTIDRIIEFLHDRGFSANRFVGQADTASNEGMTQTEQKSVLDDFRAGEFDVLVATSVAEEGLDIPTVDLVLFYEPVGSAIRSIQRSGRTGRQSAGRVIIMVAKGTRDEGLYWASKKRQDTMEEDIKQLKKIEGDLNEELGGEGRENADITSFVETEDTVGEDDVVDVEDAVEGTGEEMEVPDVEPEDDDVAIIHVDNRELDSEVPPFLNKRDGVEVNLMTLDVGDYVLSDRVGVERKSMEDFLDTLTGDRDMFEQLGDLANNYSRPVLILEGSLDDLFSRNIHPEAIYGALDTLAVSYGVHIIPSRSAKETAAHLARIARREQVEESRESIIHDEKTHRTVPEQQEYVVSSVADVGLVTARALLNHLGTPRAVFSASESELRGAEGVGPKTARKIVDVVTEEYVESGG